MQSPDQPLSKKSKTSNAAPTKETNARIREKVIALHNEIKKHQKLARVSYYYNRVNYLRDVLRQYISNDEINRIEARAIQQVDDKLGDDKQTKARGARTQPDLQGFFKAYPDITPVQKVELLSPEERKKYKDFLDEKNPERVERRREHYRQYDAAHREDRKEAQKKRRIENPEAVRAIEAAYRSTDNGKLVTLFKDTRRWAESKGLPFNITKELIADLSKEPCYYCGDALYEYGVDAVDINAGFVDGNVRPCCRVCNKAKKDHHYRDFLRMMCNIGMVHSSDMDTAWVLDYTFTDTFKEKGSVSFTHYKADAKARSIPFHLTQSQFTELTAQPCWYCRVERNGQPVGLDKVNPKGPYRIDNVVPSCATCNVLKWDTPQNVFLDKACKILKKWASK